MSNVVRIACFQRPDVCGDIKGTIAALKRDVAWAEQRGADMCLFPEGFLLGYPHSRAAVSALALRSEDAAIQALLDALAPFQPTVVVGFIEAAKGAFYNSALVARQGHYLGLSRKYHPNEEGISPATDAPLFDIGGSCFGISICNDANYPETLAMLARKGARIILAPLNNMLPHATANAWREKTPSILQERARETGCWVASSDVVGTRAGYKSFGCTAIISPIGDIVAKAPEGTPGAIIQTLNIQD